MNLRFMELAIVGALVASTAAQAQDQDQQNKRAAAHQAQAKDQRQDNRAARRQDQRQDNKAMRQDLRQDRRVENRAVRQDLRQDRQDLRAFQRNVQSTRRFRDGGWRPPVGYSYRRWTFGQSLPPAFYARDYWLNNWAAFALFAPPPGLVWVRYGPDALLIHPNSGEIVQVRYGVFY